jgi:nicotinate phosphoribosyltransferase
MDLRSTPLLTDFYQLNMLQAYLEHSMNKTAVFEFFVRQLPPQRSFLVAAGLEQVLEYLQVLRFSQGELEWLAERGDFSKDFLDYLAAFHFTGDVHAMAEGTLFFAQEPILRVTAPLMEAQLVETRIINILHFQSMIASKAARMVLAAPGKTLVDFGLRRAHGAEAGLLAARASYLVGFSGTATLAAQKIYGIPTYGTMAHSFIQAFVNEEDAFAAFARSRPRNVILLIDTYDTEGAAEKIVALAPRLSAEGIHIHGVRIDSGDIIAQSQQVRRILDVGGLESVTIFVSGGLDERDLRAAAKAGAPISGFGIGTALTTSSDAPALDCAYKLQEYAGLPRRKRSPGKETLPGRKQVWRRYAVGERMTGDIISLEDDRQEGVPLLDCVMRQGSRLGPHATLETARAHAASELRRLPPALRELEPAAPYPVTISDTLRTLATAFDQHLTGPRGASK